MKKTSNGLKLLSEGIPLIDVRAPIEFQEGSLPGAHNIPLMNNEERHEIGSIYKEKGHQAAVDRGHQLINGDIKDIRIKKWISFIEKNPQAVLYCFRGGLRSQITQQWLSEAGCEISLIEGGYKAVRSGLIQMMEDILPKLEFKMVSGSTGSGKTKFIQEQNHSSIDLEKLARHRGSAFGGFADVVQPSQIDFENALILELIKLKDKPGPIYIESESRLIGRNVLPPSFYEKMLKSSWIEIECSLDERVDHIFEEYILKSPLSHRDLSHFQSLKNSLSKISKKLGGLRYQELVDDLEKSEAEFIKGGELQLNKEWIRKLLVWYYDPLYIHSQLRRHNNKI